MTIVITVVAGVLSAGVCEALGAGALKHSLLESSPLPSEDRGGEGGEGREGGGAASTPSPPPAKSPPGEQILHVPLCPHLVSSLTLFMH